MRIVVTGAGSGIGAATARLLASQGHQLVCMDRDAASLRVVAGKHTSIAVDVADEAAVIATFREAGETMGGLDGLATCAGIYETTPFFETTAEIFRHVHDVNVIGTFLCLREAAKLMQPGSRICTVASVAGLRGGGLAGTVSYASSKGGVLAVTKNAARALADRGIAVNTVAPGMIETPFVKQPLSDPSLRKRIEGMAIQNRLGTAEEIAEAISWLLSPHSSFCNGMTLVADGGMVMH
jgi:NAD(P)-dependent dehydrogenase (short-subunit alcohol dehydrogenase family)